MPDNFDQKKFEPWTPATYRIEVQGKGGEQLSDIFGQMHITTVTNKDQSVTTTLVGRMQDQAELSGLLTALYDMHLSITSVTLVKRDEQDRTS